MALTEDFDGGPGLPSGWTVDSPQGGETITVSDSHVHITTPAGTNYDSFSSPSNADNSAGITHAVPDNEGDLDFAVQCDTDISNRQWVGWGILAFGATTDDGVRFTVYQNNSAPNALVFSYTRAGGSGAAVANNGNLPTPPQTTAFSWLRLWYIAATGEWGFMGSTDGVNWVELQTATRQFSVQRVKICMISASTFPGGTVRIQKCVDLLNAGTADLRDPITDVTQSPLMDIQGSDTIIPPGVVDDSAASGSVTFPGTGVVFETDLDVNGSRGRLLWSGATLTDVGVHCVFTHNQNSTSAFFAVGIGANTGNPSDQYSVGPAYIFESNGGTSRRFIRVDPNDDIVDFEAPYGRFLQDALGNGDELQHARIERVGRRVRARWWLDVDPEPSTWDLFDGQDQVHYDVPMAFAVVLSHNDGTTGGPASVTMQLLEMYELTATALADLEGTGDTAADGQGTLTRSRAIASTSDTAADGTGILLRSVNVNAVSDTAADGVGTLAVVLNLSGTGDTAADGSGVLIVEDEFIGRGDAAGDAVGTLSLIRSFSSVGDAAADGTAALTSIRSMSGFGDAAADGYGVMNEVIHCTTRPLKPLAELRPLHPTFDPCP